MQEIRFSLIVPSYNRPEKLARCLRSIASLEGYESDTEVIIVDDGSNPPYADSLTDLAPQQCRLVRIEHGGVAAARNAGIEHARGALLAFIADDYTLPPDYLKTAEWFFATYRDAPIVTWNLETTGAGYAARVQDTYHRLVLFMNARARADSNGVIFSSTIPASRAAMFEREVFSRVGPFDATLQRGEDGEMGFRLAKHGIALAFLGNRFVHHEEERTLADFLRQRSDNARSLAHLHHRDAEHPRRAGIRTLVWCVGSFIYRIFGWSLTAARNGLVSRYLMALPGLALFLIWFYVSYACELARLGRNETR